MTTTKQKNGESQRIYWQQWVHTNNPDGSRREYHRRELITSSAAIRIHPDHAKASDVTQLLRDTLKLSSPTSSSSSTLTTNNAQTTTTTTTTTPPHPQYKDSLVLVGTLYTLPKDYIQFEHEPPPPSLNNGMNTTESTTTDPFHVIKTLAPEDNPLSIRDQMMIYLQRIQQEATTIAAAAAASAHETQATMAMTTTTTTTTETTGSHPTTTSTMAPKCQWYFVPEQQQPPMPTLNGPHGGNTSTTVIPSCIELDGYCTSLEDDDSRHESEEEDDDVNDDDFNNANNHEDEDPPQDMSTHPNCVSLDCDDEIDTGGDGGSGGYFDVDLLLSRCPFAIGPATGKRDGNRKGRRELVGGGGGGGLRSCWSSALSSSAENRELRRYFQLCQVPPCCSGYLLKQSNVDPHVWKRVFCVLTDDHLWYTTRVPYTNESMTTRTTPLGSLRMGKRHGQIALDRALLLEPEKLEYNKSSSSQVLFPVPYSFEVVNARGTSHMFRASNRILQRQWIAALTNKIMESFENSLMDQAELIVADETMARNRRISALAVEPLYQEEEIVSSSSRMYWSLIRATVLRFGVSIAEYKELCRHVQTLLPAKQAVMARSDGRHNLHPPETASNGGKESQNGRSSSSSSSSLHDDDESRSMIRQIKKVWREADRLYDRATHVTLAVQQYAQHQRGGGNKPTSTTGSLSHHSMETNFRHIEFVLKGNPHSSSIATTTASTSTATNTATTTNNNATRSTSGSSTGSSDPRSLPPIELFDLLLSQLQGLVRKA